MANYAYHTGPKGAIIYAKPLDLVTTPNWAADAIAFTESSVTVPDGKRNTFKSNVEVDPTRSYQVFQQVGGAKASTDTRVAIIPQSDTSILTAITNSRQAIQDDVQDVRGAVETVGAAVAEIELSPVVSLTVLPGTVRQSELQKGSKLRAYVGQRSPILGTVFDSANAAVDLSGRVLAFKIATANEVAFATIVDADITITGTDHNSFYFDPPTGLVERARVFQWSLRDTADDSNLGSGELEVIYAP